MPAERENMCVVACLQCTYHTKARIASVENAVAYIVILLTHPLSAVEGLWETVMVDTQLSKVSSCRTKCTPWEAQTRNPGTHRSTDCASHALQVWAVPPEPSVVSETQPVCDSVSC